MRRTIFLGGLLLGVLLLNACGGGSDGGSLVSPSPSPVSSPSPTPTPSPSPTPDVTVNVSGTVTYDYVPHLNSGALDYTNIEARPVRGATIGIYGASDNLIAWAKTDNAGEYSVDVGEDINVKVRVLAELHSTASPTYNIKVTDNTQDNALYVLEGSVASTGTTDSTRDLHAPSGWTGTSYTQTRTAAPFAILDSVWQVVEDLVEADPVIDLAPVELRWSTQNIAAGNDPSAGEIGTSHFDGDHIYILGHADNDTDEYDRSVVQHEFAHYLSSKISRDDSIGGLHGGSTPIDMRLSFSEGFANAFTALVSGTGYYEDSAADQQSSGFRVSLENNQPGTPGFFNEDTVGELTYDLFDTDDDGVDTISLPFSVLYETISDVVFAESPALTSIYLFNDTVRSLVNVSENEAIDDLLNDLSISGQGIYGEGETNASIYSDALPVYHEVEIGGSVDVCGGDSDGVARNGLEIRRFVRLNIATPGDYTITVNKLSGTGTRDPDFIVFNKGNEIGAGETLAEDFESLVVNLAADEYVIEVYDFNNVAQEEGTPFGPSCFRVSVSN